MLPMTAGSSSLEVMIEVVNLYRQGDLVAGLTDISDVVHVWSLLVMCKQTQGVYNMLWETILKLVIEVPVLVYY